MSWSWPAVVAVALWAWMAWVALRWSHHRNCHRATMISAAVFDMAMPFYLYATHDWYQQLIVDLDIFTFFVWMHFGLVLTLYLLYFWQIRLGWAMFRGSVDDAGFQQQRVEHRQMGIGLLTVRALVIATGYMLAPG